MLTRWHRRYWVEDRAALEKFEGRVPFVVVTGGSDGIGLAIARCFLDERRAVLLVARDEVRLAKARATLRRGDGDRVEVMALDVAATDAGHRIDHAVARFGGYVDVLVNSAGVGLSGPFAGHEDSALQGLLDLNVRAVAMLSRYVLGDMRVRGRGGIINIASLGGYAPGPYQASYYASKAFVISLTEAIAYENRGLGVSITAVAPGPVRTAFHERMGAERGWYLTLLPQLSPEAVARAALIGFKLHQRVVLPGLLNRLMMPAMRLVPHRLLEPLIGWLLHPQKADALKP